jgi:hypothetical protein
MKFGEIFARLMAKAIEREECQLKLLKMEARNPKIQEDTVRVYWPISESRPMRRLLILLALLGLVLLIPCRSQAQYVALLGSVQSPLGQALPGVNVAVCPILGSVASTRCSPLASAYNDRTGTQGTADNPTQSDGKGNFSLYVSPGMYYVQRYGGALAGTQLAVVTVPCDPSYTYTSGPCATGSGGSGGATSYFFTQATAATTWTIDHNLGSLGSSSITFACYDTTGQYLIPDTADQTTSNVVTLTFTSAQAGSCLIVGTGSVPAAVAGLNATNSFSALNTFNAGANILGGGALSGTFMGSPLFPLSSNAAIKPASASAYYFVTEAANGGSDLNDGLSPGSAFATPQHCISVVLALGGGTCDARTLYSYTYGNTQRIISIGQHSPLVPLTFLLPPYGTWTCNLTGGAQACLEVFNGGAAIGTSSGQGNQFIITASSTANVVDVCGTDPSTADAYLHMENFNCQSQSGAAVSGAVMDIQHLVDISRVTDLSSMAASTNTKSLWIHGVGGSAQVERVKGHGDDATGNVPCTLGSTSDENEGADIGPISCTNSGSGENAVAIVQGSGTAGAHYHDIYAEMNVASDTSTPVIGVTNSSGETDVIENVHFGNDAAGGSSTRCIVDIADDSSVIVRNIQESNATCGIDDHNAGRGILNPGASAVITDYSTENPCCSLVGSFTKPLFWGMTNGTGSQLFNTTTTCTTAAGVGDTCTTGSISLPVTEPDTSYRIVCTGKGPSNVPTIVATANSSSGTFTITIAALTAAAASYSSFDCLVEHN